ncbi:MAG: TonB C-terminal domain-containing protein [Gemmatimonadota bacterium]|nr:TonB C-terminal domain-containing protein [Gemmatimonadota bacterium]MDH3424457.1 TonB C-terminal domain-containing protein [Gemmatimonadota bacterium]
MRRVDPFNTRAAAYSMVLHATVFAVVWLSTLRSPPQFEFIAYEIELVSPPPAAQAEEPQPAVEELVVERPEPEPSPPEPEAVAAPIEPAEPEPDPVPQPEPQTQPNPPEPAVQDEPATTADAPPETTAETSGENLNVRLEGLRRDYPAYYDNIIRQIQRCFRWRTGGSWETAVAFTIRRDGLASDIEFLNRSGNTAFDFEAMGAVDCAGQGRFGPLPEDLPWPAVRISFTFEPPSDQD